MTNKAVVGVFSYFDDLLAAVKHAQSEKREFRTYSPAPNHELEEATSTGRSPVRWVTLTGALLGVTAGFTLATWTSMDYPMRTSAKNVLSIPAFFVVGYEWTILWGGIATLLAIFYFCRLPDFLRKVGYDPRFSDDKFGIVLSCDANEATGISNELRKLGAEDVDVRDGL